METNRINDLKINGNGTSTGGLFRSIKINGNGNIKGDTDTLDLKVNGLGDFYGNVKIATGKIAGKGSVLGNINAQVLNVNGLLDVSGNLTVSDFNSNGQVEIGGKVSTENLVNRGILKVEGDCNSETFKSEGLFKIKGLLNSGTIEILLHHTSFAKEIGGDHINVRKGGSFEIKSFIKSLFPAFEMNLNLNTDSIEGDEIYLEYTKAKVVRGNNVNIGPGCEIDLVEYKNSFIHASNTKVASAVQMVAGTKPL